MVFPRGTHPGCVSPANPLRCAQRGRIARTGSAISGFGKEVGPDARRADLDATRSALWAIHQAPFILPAPLAALSGRGVIHFVDEFAWCPKSAGAAFGWVFGGEVVHAVEFVPVGPPHLLGRFWKRDEGAAVDVGPPVCLGQVLGATNRKHSGGWCVRAVSA
jgi:hypothetical protein